MDNNNDMTTWRNEIETDMKSYGESFDDVVATAPADLDLDRKFDSGYGGNEGRPFTLWTTGRVYFPVVYDGSEWVESVPRNPCNEVSAHVGGQ